MMRAVAVMLALAASGPAQALSCVRPDVAQTYDSAASSDAVYSVLYGVLEFDQNALPPSMNSSFTPQEPAPIAAQFRGAFLHGGAFVDGFGAALDLHVGCEGPWCGSLNAGAEYILFVEHGNGALQLEVGACPFWAFEAPTVEQLEILTQRDR